MITTPNDFKSYFASLATALGCSFEYGNSERILNRQNSGLTYPVLWCESPSVKLVESGGLHARFYGAIVLLSNRDVDDWAGQDTAQDEMYSMAIAALQKMEADAPGEFIFEMHTATLDKKEKWSADDDWGWRIEFDLLGAVACPV